MEEHAAEEPAAHHSSSHGRSQSKEVDAALRPHLIIGDGGESDGAGDGEVYEMDDVLCAAQAAAEWRERVTNADLDYSTGAPPSIAAQLNPTRTARIKSGGKLGKYKRTATVDDLN